MNKNQAEYYYDICDGIFKRFPELRPAVGDYYWREDGAHKKLLLVGESNYLKYIPDEECVFKNSQLWYYGDCLDKLFPLSWKKKNNSISGSSSNWKLGCYGGFKSVGDILDEVLKSNHIAAIEGIAHEIAFYDYYLRPADGANSFNPDDLDKKIAGRALSEVLETLETDILIFLSKKAFDDFNTYEEKNKPINPALRSRFIDYVNHPSRQCWSEENGARKFKRLLTEYWIGKH